MWKHLVVLLWVCNYVDSVSIPDCGQPTVPTNAYIVNGKAKYESGDRVTFKCVAGYSGEGIATTLCFMGRWNVMPFRCDKGGCGDPGTPENGNKLGISYAPGREVFFFCNVGYVRVGPEQRRCLPDNMWSGTQPTCKQGGCGDPGTPENGNKVGISYAPGREVLFSCNVGYVRVGSERRRCLPNNTWSGTQPTCKLVDGGPPKVPTHRTIIGNETTFQKFMSFKCDKGFELKGSAIAIFQSHGKLSINIQPECKLRIRCGDPGTPMNGIKKGLSYLHGNLLFFACNFGYKIVGSKSRQCLGNSQWSGVQPKCKSLFKGCGQPQLPQDAYITPKKTTMYSHGEIVTVKCKKGFLPRGIEKTQCFMGTWSDLHFSCINTL